MSGGLFNVPFVLNIKCIVFALICMSLFLYSPNFRYRFSLYITLFIIFVISYVVMAWYDYFYDCTQFPLKRGESKWYNITNSFKPPMHKQDKQDTQVIKITKEESKMESKIVYLLHILFIVPFLTYIVSKGNNNNKNIYHILGALTIFTLFYHSSYLIMAFHKK
jgi:hypothetical protein